MRTNPEGFFMLFKLPDVYITKARLAHSMDAIGLDRTIVTNS